MSDQSDAGEPVGKINTGAAGLGTVTPEMVEERASQLARMDGRTAANERDRSQAREELVGPSEDAEPEASDRVEDIVTWDDAPESSGVKAPEVAPPDDSTISETLVREGMDEAEHEQRLSAVEENPPESEEV